jgi:type I restriction enzyme R subunit
MTKTETYEEKAKALFIKEPANMKLLIVVDKLLTGFDAPPCTYLYIDKSMQDHGLFQAICRTNRLDGEDKDFGYIVDYKDLFKKVENAIAVYTSELDHSAGGADPEVMMQGPAEAGPGTAGQRAGSAGPAVRAGGAAQGRAGAHPLLLRQHRDADRPQGARAAARRALQGRGGAGARLRQHRRRTGSGRLQPGRHRAHQAELDQYLDLREIIRKASGETWTSSLSRPTCAT